MKIKQIVVINNKLKMRKGKIARVCLMLGYKSHKMLSAVDSIRWFRNNHKAVILKSDLYEEHLQCVESRGKETKCHIDAGKTSVDKGSNCGFVFFMEEGEISYIEELKLV